MTGNQRPRLAIGRAPVRTLWAPVAAERLGFDRDEALSLGRAVAGINAYSRGGLDRDRVRSTAEQVVASGDRTAGTGSGDGCAVWR